MSIVLLLLTAAFTWADSSSRVEFDDLPALVAERNQHVTGAALKKEASLRQTGYLLRSYLPTLEAQVGGEAYQLGPQPLTGQPFGGVTARLNLFRGGRDWLEERSRTALANQADAGLEQRRMEELTKARRTFWDLVYQKELLNLVEEAIQKNQANLASANKRIQAGLATETDRIEFQMYAVQLEQDRARLILGKANSERMLNVLIGRPENTPIETIASIPHQHDDAILEKTLVAEAHRDVRALSAESESARSLGRQASRWWMPTLDLYGSYTLYPQQEREYPALVDRFEFATGVQLTFNVFDGLHANAEGAANTLKGEGSRLEAQQTAKELAAAFEGAKQELRLTHDLIHAGEQSVVAGTDYLRRTQAEYVRGVKNSPDVFAATEKYIDLRRRYADLRRDYQIAKAELLAMLGQ
jgi:outer membrane protein TolC